MNDSVKVIYRSCDDMDHILLYKDNCLLSDEYEGFPRSSPLEVLECLAKHGVIELEKEAITDEESDCCETDDNTMHCEHDLVEMDILIGRRMRTLRKELGIKQSEAAEKVGVTKYTISRMENGRYHTKEEIIISLCHLYGVDYKEFMRSVFE